VYINGTDSAQLQQKQQHQHRQQQQQQQHQHQCPDDVMTRQGPAGESYLSTLSPAPDVAQSKMTIIFEVDIAGKPPDRLPALSFRCRYNSSGHSPVCQLQPPQLLLAPHRCW